MTDFEVKQLTTKKQKENAKDLATCGTCKRSWDDGISTSITPTPSGRCPFEYFHHAILTEQEEHKAMNKDTHQSWEEKDAVIEELVSALIHAQSYIVRLKGKQFSIQNQNHFSIQATMAQALAKAKG